MIWSITAKFLKWCKTDLPFAQHRSCQFLHQGWLSRDQWGPDCWQSPGQLWSARGVTLRETSLVNLLNGIISSWTLNKKRLSYKKLLFFCQKKEAHLVICASIFLIDEMLSLWLSLCDWDESLKMVAISIPVSPGILSLHTRAQHCSQCGLCRPEQTNQRRDRQHWPIRGQQGVDHETIVNTDNIFNLQIFFWSQIKLECVALRLFRGRGVFYILPHT